MKSIYVLIIFCALSTKLSAQSCAEILQANDRSPTPASEAAVHSPSIAFAQNIAVSLTGFYAINLAQFRREFRSGRITMRTLFAISFLEVSKNLINYVVIENSAQIALSFVSLSVLNTFRMSLHTTTQKLSPWVMIAETSLAEVLKNRLNFVVTENWFPVEWSKPPNCL